jgi:peptidoglycan/xylan/chitin deacetylase (PgdA/CDA1 family)
VTWTLDSNDWQCRTAEEAARCAAEVLTQARAGDTILFHDTHRWIGPILDTVIPGLAARGLLGVAKGANPAPPAFKLDD